mmetsp:Transcript_10862/g.19228  ORF Transcript_10862/g.19228 Transcript_10862/m.19228 type:complete len:90 (-) Transcript_10862:161-430(-)
MSRHVFRLMENTGGHEEDGTGPGLTCLAVGGDQDGQHAICEEQDGSAYVVHISGKKLVATLPHFEEPSNTTNTTRTTKMKSQKHDPSRR